MPNKKHIDSNALLLDLYSEIALLINYFRVVNFKYFRT